MDDIYVGRLMTASPITVTPDTLVEDAAETMLTEEVGSLLVTDGEGELLGILTSTDFVNIVAESHPKAETTVERYMSTDLTTTTAQTPIQEVADVMVSSGIHHVPVVDQREGLVGIISTTDLTGYISEV